MITLKRLLAVAIVALISVAPAGAQQSSPSSPPQPAPAASQPQQQTEFVPLDQLPPQEQLPAPRLLIAAYSFVLAALFLYVLSVARRVSGVRREVERLETDLKRSGRA
jgi:CcmD family protein